VYACYYLSPLLSSNQSLSSQTTSSLHIADDPLIGTQGPVSVLGCEVILGVEVCVCQVIEHRLARPAEVPKQVRHEGLLFAASLLHLTQLVVF
jgi:hypothetical protein